MEETVHEKGETSKKKRKKRATTSYLLEFFVKLFLTVLIIWALCTYMIGIFVNHSNSAYPMIKDGDLCVTYRLSELQQGDAIVYCHDKITRYGRIAAFEGDVVEIENDSVVVNGYQLFDDVVYPTTSEGSSITYPYTVPENCVFVLNDYRSDTADSRTFGGIPMEETKGKVIFLMRRRGI